MLQRNWKFLIAAALCAPSLAQNVPQPNSATAPLPPGTGDVSGPDAARQPSGNNPVDPAAAASQGSGSGEIVVTATRQAQLISRVPISVSAFSQQNMDLKGMKSFNEVARFTPGVQFDPTGNQISIRGISSGAGSGTTGIYIDDTPIQIRNLGFSADNSAPAIFDLDRVEVLRGPQGTLFGAGSEGGTVRYITPQPGLTRWSTYDRAEIARTDNGATSYEVGSAVGGPIVSDVLGMRVSAWHRRDGGYIDHVDYRSGAVDARDINHGDVTVLRAAAAWQPASGLLITPSLLYQRRTTNAAGTFFPAISDGGDQEFRTGSPEYRNSRDRYILPTLNVRYDAGAVSFISNTSYFKRTNHSGYDGTLYDLSYYQSCYRDGCGFQDSGVDGSLYPFLLPTGVNPALPPYRSPSRVTNLQKIWTEEARLQSSDPDARLKWVVGIFYQHSKQRSTEELVDPQGNDFFNTVFGQSLEDFFGYPLYGQDSYINNTDAVDRQIAGFVDITYELLSGVKLSAGGRIAHTRYSFTNFADGSQNGARTTGSGRTSETPFTPKVGVDWQVDPNNLLYATWAKGFRPGGANPPVPYNACAPDLQALGLTAAPDSYKSDTVRSVEVGSKNKLLGNRLQMAASVYQINWTGIQQAVSLPTCAIQFTGNLGSARSRGFDLQLTLSPVPGLTIDGTAGYTSARYTKSVVLGPGQNVVLAGDAVGSPPWTLSLGGQYDFPVGRQRFYARGDVTYQSRLDRPTPARDPLSEQYDEAALPDAAVTQVSARVGAVIGDLNVSVFADNLLNASPRIDYGHPSRTALLFTQRTLRPRTIGVTVAYRQ